MVQTPETILISNKMEELVVPLQSRVVHKFYEPLVLLKSLNIELVHKGVSERVDVNDYDFETDPRKLFEAFVNKLAHICDSAKGGDTVTSLMILSSRDTGHLNYCFASNQREDSESNVLILYMQRLLEKIGATTSEQQVQLTKATLLREILLFNRRRVGFYLTTLYREAETCLRTTLKTPEDIVEESEDKIRQNFDLGRLRKLEYQYFKIDHELENQIAQNLNVLIGILDFANDGQTSEHEFLHGCAVVIQHLQVLEQSEIGQKLRSRARGIRLLDQSSLSCWAEMWHMSKRLLAYAQSIEFFFLAKASWPQLFEDFAVTYLPSSQAHSAPRRVKSQTAESIVGRMTRKEKEMEIFRGFVRDLQLFKLDVRIQQEYQNPNFRPVVHSELLLLNHLETSGGVRQDRFFNQWTYIGSSKPTCKLCHYYFEEHQSRVAHRESHGNLYLSWRVPDVLERHGQEGIKHRQIMVDRMLLRIRKETFDIVRKKARPTYREHDSLTSSASLTIAGGFSVLSISNIEDRDHHEWMELEED